MLSRLTYTITEHGKVVDSGSMSYTTGNAFAYALNTCGAHPAKMWDGDCGRPGYSYAAPLCEIDGKLRAAAYSGFKKHTRGPRVGKDRI